MHSSFLLILVLLHASFGLAAPASIIPGDDTVPVTQIKQTINKFPLFVDGHQFSRLTEVFTTTATANLHPPNNQVYHGVDQIIQGVSGLQNVSSQHGFTSQYVNVTSLNTATAVFYLFANFYGQGAQKGQIFTVYGRYDFQAIQQLNGWRVNDMQFTIYVRNFLYPSFDAVVSNFEQFTKGNETIAFPDGT